MILDGKIASQTIYAQLRQSIVHIPINMRPHLAVVLVGENPASLAYIRAKQKRAEEIGMRFSLFRFPHDVSEKELLMQVTSISENSDIHGLIVQAPLPQHIDGFRLTENIHPAKDVDGFSRTQIGNMFLGHDGLWSCTPKGIFTLMHHYGISVEGKRVAILGRSNIVGKPLALMMINAGATVTSCNSKTPNIEHITRDADIVIVAIGKPKFLTKDMVRKESIVIDVGSNLQNDGSFCGDADFDHLHNFVHAISPSP